MNLIHQILAAFDSLLWWQQIGIGVIALLATIAAVGTAWVMAPLVGRTVDSDIDQALEEADRIAEHLFEHVPEVQPRPAASFRQPAAKGLSSRRPYARQDFGSEERRAALRGQQRRRS